MKTTEEPTSSLRQTLEWLRKELVRLCTSLYLTPSPHVFRGPLFLPPRCPLGGAELQAGVWAPQAPIWDEPHSALLPPQALG